MIESMIYLYIVCTKSIVTSISVFVSFIICFYINTLLTHYIDIEIY